jgi:uncharacterized protein
MVKVVITSDVHGHLDRLQRIAQLHHDADYFLDAGDSEGSESLILPFVSVEGNNDYSHLFPKTRVIDAHPHKIYMTHSHEFFVSQRDEGLVKKAKRLGCDIVIYGHSHVPDIKEMYGITLINPGSLYYNRDRSPLSYVVLTIQDHAMNIETIPYK